MHDFSHLSVHDFSHLRPHMVTHGQTCNLPAPLYCCLRLNYSLPPVPHRCAPPVQLSANEPLLLNYGQLSNDFLLMDYGFLVPQNPHDRVQLRFTPELLQVWPGQGRAGLGRAGQGRAG